MGSVIYNDYFILFFTWSNLRIKNVHIIFRELNPDRVLNESAFDFLGMYGCTYGKQELAQQRNNVQFLLASVNIAFEERKYILLFRA